MDHNYRIYLKESNSLGQAWGRDLGVEGTLEEMRAIKAHYAANWPRSSYYIRKGPTRA